MRRDDTLKVPVGSRGTEIGETGYRGSDVVLPSPQLLSRDLPSGLNGSGRLLLEKVVARGSIELDELADVLETTYGLTRQNALADVATFVQRGQVAGLLSYRTDRGQMRGALRFARDLVLLPVRGGISLPSIQRTHSAYSLATMVRSTISAQVLLGLVTTAVALVPLSLIGGFWSSAGLSFASGLALGIVGGLVVLGVAHESAHAFVASGLRSPPHSVYRQGLRVGLQRARLTPAKDLLVASVGPVAGTVAGCLVVALVQGFDSSSPSALTRAMILGSCIATALQVACLVPPAADGRVIMACIRALRTKTPRTSGEPC